MPEDVEVADLSATRKRDGRNGGGVGGDFDRLQFAEETDTTTPF